MRSTKDLGVAVVRDEIGMENMEEEIVEMRSTCLVLLA